MSYKLELEEIKNKIIDWGRPKCKPDIFINQEFKYANVKYDAEFIMEVVVRYVESLFEVKTSWFINSPKVTASWASPGLVGDKKVVSIRITGPCYDESKFDSDEPHVPRPYTLMLYR